MKLKFSELKQSRFIVILLGGMFVLLLGTVFYFYFKKYPQNPDSARPSPYQVLAVFEDSPKLDPLPTYHIELHWNELEPGNTVPEPLDSGNGPLLISIYTHAKCALKPGYNAVLETTISGGYNAKIAQLAQWVRQQERPIWILWNPLPEVPLRDYPWQLQDPQDYIEAFRHFSKALKAEAPEVLLGYGTAGYPGVMEYFPGDSALDFSTVIAYPEVETRLEAYPLIDSLPQMLKRKLHRFRFSDKPVLVLKGENYSSGNKELKEAMIGVRREFDSLQDFMESNDRKRPSLAAESFKIGLYDPQERLLKHKAVDVEHLFLNWKALDSGPFRKDFAEALERGHQVIVTAEPFKDSAAHQDREVLQHILDGKYDSTISELYALLGSTSQRIYLRFAHEMEIPIKRYPWQSQDPLEYIRAYRYFMTFGAGLPANVKTVWGPAGDRGSLEWYPGDDLVDYISIAIYALPDVNIEDYRQQEKFSDIFKRKVWRMRQAQAPIFITEFGVKGPEDFQSYWLKEAAQTLNQNPGIAGACYFNLYDNPAVWGNMEAPNWSISENSFNAFVNNLELDKLQVTENQ